MPMDGRAPVYYFLGLSAGNTFMSPAMRSLITTIRSRYPETIASRIFSPYAHDAMTSKPTDPEGKSESAPQDRMPIRGLSCGGRIG
jgi:hypothetical protein